MNNPTVDFNSGAEIAVIGGAGHVGLPLGILLATSGNAVTLVDQDEVRLKRIADGELPFDEPGGQPLLEEAIAANRLGTTSDLSVVESVDVIIVVIGTPTDEHHNPEVAPLLDLIDDLIEYLQSGQLLVFRSTVYPGTTSLVADRLDRAGFTIGEDLYLSFAPERIAQHRAFEEVVQLPQIIGAFEYNSYQATESLFDSFIEADCLRLLPTEAELGKLFTNMWRYLTFAAANEFYLIADSFASQHDVNINKILDITGQDYPRFDAPSPGANVGGPCLTKDGWFLVDNIPYSELVSTSYQINEGLPAQITERMANISPEPAKIAILGMTFKPNSDDIRNSVAFKLRKQLRLKGYSDVVEIEPNLTGFDNWEDVAGSDWVILMTPHDEFEDLGKIQRTVANDEALYCDIWGYWEEMRHDSDNGYFLGCEGDFSNG